MRSFCLQSYGFQANPALPLPNNFQTALSTLTPTDFKQPKNLTFHNLCKENSLPIGSKTLLGLNLKFCLSANTLPNDIKQTVLRMARSIRIRYFLLDNNTATSSNYENKSMSKTPTGTLLQP
jgi:hypothetical protein